MKLEVFKEIIRLLKEQNEKDHTLYKLGLDLIEFTSPLESVISHLISSIYGKDGKETFDWWCYEKEWGSRKDLTMTDKDGIVICETVEDLYEYLENNITSDYELPKKYTDKERIGIIDELFGHTKPIEGDAKRALDLAIEKTGKKEKSAKKLNK
jgi:hypothetical protein